MLLDLNYARNVYSISAYNTHDSYGVMPKDFGNWDAEIEKIFNDHIILLHSKSKITEAADTEKSSLK